MYVASGARGYKMLLVNPAIGINASLYKKLFYNFTRGIAPVAGFALIDLTADQVGVLSDNLPTSVPPCLNVKRQHGLVWECIKTQYNLWFKKIGSIVKKKPA